MKKQCVVIGSGPGGYVAAIRASQMGLQTTIIEKGNIGGVCLNEGCIPSKALIEAGHFYQNALSRNPYGVKVEGVSLDFKATQSWKDKRVVYKLTKGIELLLQKNNVEIILGEAQFVNDNTLVVNEEEIEFEHCIIATGSTPVLLRDVSLSENIVDSTGALNFSELPSHLVVVGGGYIGSELASAYRNLGTEVTIVEAAPQILINFDSEMVDIVVKNFKQRKIKMMTNALVESVEENENGVTLHINHEGVMVELSADKVLVSIGRRPNSSSLNLENTSVRVDERGFIITDETGRTDNHHIYAIGDVTSGLALAHKASYEAKVVVENICGQSYDIKDKVIPAIAFVEPECASAGLEFKDVSDDYVVVKFDYAANGRALTLNQNQGFIRMIVDPEDNVILGAQIIGHNASELIGECGLAIENKLTLDQVVETIHAHPTTNEMILDVAEAALGLPIHS